MTRYCLNGLDFSQVYTHPEFVNYVAQEAYLSLEEVALGQIKLQPALGYDAYKSRELL